MVAKDTSFTATVSVAGVALIEINPGAQTWTAQQISTEYRGAPIGSLCEVRKNGAIVSKAIPSGDVLSGLPYVILQPGDLLTVRWTGGVAGDTAKATLFYDNGV